MGICLVGNTGQRLRPIESQLGKWRLIVKSTMLVTVAVLLILASVLARAESPAVESFHQLKALTGTWTGTNLAGEPLIVSFRETSAGSAVLSEVHVGNPAVKEMISMFHLDGSRLMLTHYCT